MSKLHQPHGRADADTDKGELRKPDDYSNQPGQGGAYRGDGGHPQEDGGTAEGTDAADHPPSNAMPPDVGETSREYGHSSGDRNTMERAGDFHGFKGGIQRDAAPGAPDDAQAQRTTRREPADPDDEGS